MISSEALETENITLFEKLDAQSTQGHPVSWYFFVPNEAVRRYTRDSFTRLVIPGFEKNTLTWEEARHDLAKNYFRILSTENYRGLIPAKSLGRVSKAAIADTVAWYSDFSAYQARAYFQALRAQVGLLVRRDETDLSSLGQDLLELLGKSSDHSLAWFRQALDHFQENISNLVEARSGRLNKELRSAFQSHTERDPGLIGGLVSIGQDGDRVGKKEESGRPEALFRREAFRIYSSAILDYAVSLAKGRKQSRDSRTGRVLAWLGEGRLMPQDRLQELGTDQIICRILKRFKVDCPVFLNTYFDSIIGNYLRFRRLNRLWYTKAAGASRQVEPLEIDLLLLAHLEPGSSLLKANGADQTVIKACLNWSLDNQAYLTRNQVIIDAASDFSPVQLKCMASLASAELGSVAVAADLGLRTTPWGLTSLDDLEWALPKAVVTELRVNYRQSEQLLELTDLLSGSSKNRFSSSLFKTKGPKPVLAENLSGLAETADWLADRVAEIVDRAGRLPATAVAVFKPSEVGLLSEALTKALAKNPALADYKALAARPGQTPALSNDIHVLALNDANGLEFDAFFLAALDDPTKDQPELQAKLLYLAASRAVTYLGFVFRGSLPADLDNLARLSAPSWSQPHETTITALSL
jgi:hypothetical protein